MNRIQWLQETRIMRFEETYTGWRKNRLTQEEASRLLGVSDRTFRRYLHRYELAGGSIGDEGRDLLWLG